MPNRNTVYADLGYTFYPNKIDSRDGINPNTGTPDPTRFAINSDVALNVNFDERGSDPDAIDYYVLASDINVLQDGIMAIQRVLGVMPNVRTDTQVNDTATVSERIARLESMSRFDTRLGGAGWVSGTSPTILSHTHTGGPNDAAKINLATMSTGNLGKSRLQLSLSDGDPITSANIPYSPTDGTSTKAVIDRKADRTTDNIFERNVAISGNTVCRAFGEIDCVDMVNGGTFATLVQNVTDIKAYCGSAKYFSKTAGISSNTYAYCSFPLRYNDYSVIIRMKSDNVSSAANAIKVEIRGSVNSARDTLIYSEYIACNEFITVGEYRSFYIDVSHSRLQASAYDKDLHVLIYYLGHGIASISLDSITVMPTHTGLWNDKG